MKNDTTAMETGKICKGVGGRYDVLTPSGETVICKAKGTFRYDHITVNVGDNVTFVREDTSEYALMEAVLPRKNALIRPPIANLDVLFLVVASVDPAPAPLQIDKLLSIMEHNGIDCILVVNKTDQSEEKAQKIAAVYQTAGYDVILTEALGGSGIEKIRQRLLQLTHGQTAAFAGASGVGKSSLCNALFPAMALSTGELSERIARGKHTTRRVEIYPLKELLPYAGHGYLADTPGFSMLDFERFDFFTKEELPQTFREFRQYLGQCKYTKCSHTKEDGCAILQAATQGKIPKCRHHSFLTIREELKDKKAWETKKDAPAPGGGCTAKKV